MQKLIDGTSLVLEYSDEPFERIEVYCQEDRESISIPMDVLDEFCQELRSLREDSKKSPGQRGFEKIYPGKSWKDVSLTEQRRWNEAFGKEK